MVQPITTSSRKFNQITSSNSDLKTIPIPKPMKMKPISSKNRKIPVKKLKSSTVPNKKSNICTIPPDSQEKSMKITDKNDRDTLCSLGVQLICHSQLELRLTELEVEVGL